MDNLDRFASFCVALIALNSAAGETGGSPDVFTSVIASTVSPEAYAIRGTDGVYHVVYELQLTNTKSVPRICRLKLIFPKMEFLWSWNVKYWSLIRAKY